MEAWFRDLSCQKGVSQLKLVNGTIKSQTYQDKIINDIKVSKGAKIRNPYNQVTHLTQTTNGKVTNSQLYTTNESQEVGSFSTGDHKAQINRRAQRHNKHKTEKRKRSTKEVLPWNGQLNFILEGLNQFHDANLTLNSAVEKTFNVKAPCPKANNSSINKITYHIIDLKARDQGIDILNLSLNSPYLNFIGTVLSSVKHRVGRMLNIKDRHLEK